MGVLSVAPPRDQSPGEELANSISHGVALIVTLIGTPFLILDAARQESAALIVGASIFAATAIFLYLSSTVYHALPRGRAKRIFRIIEHSAIFTLIAGTYTPFTLGVLEGAWGWTLFGLVWGLALVGVGLKIFQTIAHPVISTALYLLMGWLIVIAVKPLIDSMPLAGLLWLLAGGLSYTLGVVFFAMDSTWRYGHFLWHLFVIGGTTCHYFAILWYAG